MIIRFSKDVISTLKKLKHYPTKLKFTKQIKKIKDNPDIGKPLKFNLKSYRSVRLPPFRIIYRIDGDTIEIFSFKHRKEVYE